MREKWNDVEGRPADPWAHLHRVAAPALALAPTMFLTNLRVGLTSKGISQAVAKHNTAPIFDWIMGLVPLQGISDQIATRYAEQHGSVTYAEVQAALNDAPSCPRLGSYWHFE